MRLLFLTSVLAFAFTLPVSAHVGLEPEEVPAGTGITLSFRIGHGCEGRPTTEVSIRVPAGVSGVQPFAKPGWDLAVEEGTLPEPITDGDEPVTEGVTRVTWSGGSLEDGHADLFQIRATLHVEPGETVYFPVVQRCGDLEHAWIGIPSSGESADDLEEPAPSVVVAAGDEGSTAGAGTRPLTVVAVALSAAALAISAAALAASRRSMEGD
ncbi:MAG TPA: YcnI family protein [Acidimicrobiia bacterium]